MVQISDHAGVYLDLCRADRLSAVRPALRYHDDDADDRKDSPTAGLPAESPRYCGDRYAVYRVALRRGRYRLDPLILCDDGNTSLGESDCAKDLP